MSWEGLYSAIFLFGGLAELVLLAILLIRREYKIFPVFTVYIAFNVLCDIGVGALTTGPAASSAGWVALSLLPLQYLLELGVLFEIAWHVLWPVRASLPPKAIRIFSILVALALIGGILLAWHVDLRGSAIYVKVKAPMDLTVGLLRMLIFVVTAAFAQLLGIGWKSKVLQLATALSFYSAVDLIASVVQSRTGHSDLVDHLRATAYLMELGFLIWAFTTKEVRRREFSPQMEQFLVSISLRARNVRAAIVKDAGGIAR